MSGDKKHIVTAEELMAFMDGQLDEARRKAVEGHLKTCLECRSLLESLELAEREATRAEKVEAPEGYFQTFASRVANRIAGQELSPSRRPWLLRWGWMPAAAAAAFAAIIVLSHGFYEQPRTYEAAMKRRLIPIPIAPEPRVPETVAVLETYYEEAPVAPAAGGEPSEKDRMAASGAAQPPLPAAAPPAASEAARPSEDAAPAVSRSRASSSPGPVNVAGAPAATPPAKEVSESKVKMAAAGEVKSAEPALEIADKAQPQGPATLTEDRDGERGRKEDGPPAEVDREDDAATGLLPPRRRLVRVRQVGASRVLLPSEPAEGLCPAPEVAAVEAIVIHLPNGGGSPPPEVEPALRICLPQ